MSFHSVLPKSLARPVGHDIIGRDRAGRRDEEEKETRQVSEKGSQESIEGAGRPAESPQEESLGETEHGAPAREALLEQLVAVPFLQEQELVLEPVDLVELQPLVLEFEPRVEQFVSPELIIVVVEQLFLVVQPLVEFVLEQPVRAGRP